jgi:hypothetical protein
VSTSQGLGPRTTLPVSTDPTQAAETLELGSSELGSDEQLELTDLLNTALDKGVVLHGDVTLAVADVDLVKLNIGLLLSALETIEAKQESSGRVAGTLSNLFGPPPFGPPGTRVPTASGSAKHMSSVASASEQVVQSLGAVAHGLPERINADATGVESGLARLVLTLIEVLRKVLEHQAVRRMDGGRLTAAEIERLGLALSTLNDRMDDLKRVFGLSDEDLQIDLGPLGRLR